MVFNSKLPLLKKKGFYHIHKKDCEMEELQKKDFSTEKLPLEWFEKWLSELKE